MKPSNSTLARRASTVFTFVATLSVGADSGFAVENLRDAVLRVAFTRNVFSGINEADATAASRVWIQGIGKTRGFRLQAETEIYDHVENIESRLSEGTVDLIIVDSFHFLDLVRSEARITPVFIPDYTKFVLDDYILLSVQESEPVSLRKLKGSNLALLHTIGCNLSRIWLDTFLAGREKMGTEDFFGRTDEVFTASRAILPVYFGQYDACVVDRSSFDVMVELNPQLGAKLAVVAKSPGYLETVVCLRNDYTEYRDELISALNEMHTLPTGQQLLMIFKVDRLRPYEPRYLETVKALYGMHRGFEAESSNRWSREARADSDGEGDRDE